MKIGGRVIDVLFRGLLIRLFIGTNRAKELMEVDRLSKFRRLLLGYLLETKNYKVVNQIVNEQYFKTIFIFIFNILLFKFLLLLSFLFLFMFWIFLYSRFLLLLLRHVFQTFLDKYKVQLSWLIYKLHKLEQSNINTMPMKKMSTKLKYQD